MLTETERSDRQNKCFISVLYEKVTKIYYYCILKYTSRSNNNSEETMYGKNGFNGGLNLKSKAYFVEFICEKN